jgi:hypothetical protein
MEIIKFIVAMVLPELLTGSKKPVEVKSIILLVIESVINHSNFAPQLAKSQLSQGLDRFNFAGWYLIYGYVNGSAISCPNGISSSWL